MSEERGDRVMEMVEEVLRENPDVSNDELQERASEIAPRIGELSPRSFNARYPLQVKRKLSREGEERDASHEQDLRAKIRSTLLDFAKDVVGAEDRGAAIDVLRDVDQYIDRVMEDQ